jgi:NADPH:quinone reductase-like Zn-dependent oxidoreductase
LTSTVKTQPGECDMLVEVLYSGLNYKDALVVTGK